MSTEWAVEATGIKRAFGGPPVLAGADVRLARGGVLALLGPNGAGKTTMVKILSTLIRADAGRATVAGFDVVSQRAEVRRRISLTGQYAAVDELQTGEENLRTMGRLRGLGRDRARGRAGELLERFDLTAAARRRVGTYSGGMRRRLDLAMSLVAQPEVLFLDEPTTGLDLRSRQALWEVVDELVGVGVSLFLTTQYLEEADRLAGRIAVLEGGRVVAEGTAEQLKQSVGERRLVLTLADRAGFDAAAADVLASRRRAQLDEARLQVALPTDGSAAQVRALLDELDPDRGRVARFHVHSATLDDVFLALTGQTAMPSEPPTAAPAAEEEEIQHV